MYNPYKKSILIFNVSDTALGLTSKPRTGACHCALRGSTQRLFLIRSACDYINPEIVKKTGSLFLLYSYAFVNAPTPAFESYVLKSILIFYWYLGTTELRMAAYIF